MKTSNNGDNMSEDNFFFCSQPLMLATSEK